MLALGDCVTRKSGDPDNYILRADVHGDEMPAPLRNPEEPGRSTLPSNWIRYPNFVDEPVSDEVVCDVLDRRLREVDGRPEFWPCDRTGVPDRVQNQPAIPQPNLLRSAGTLRHIRLANQQLPSGMDTLEIYQSRGNLRGAAPVRALQYPS